MTASAAAQPAPGRQTGVSAVLWSSCVATLALGVNGTAIMAALPKMRADLALGPADVQWAVNAYLVVSAASSTRRRHFPSVPAVSRWSVSCFCRCVGHHSFLASAAMLLTGRALQGFASALAVPSRCAALGTESFRGGAPCAAMAVDRVPHAPLSVGPLFGGAGDAPRRMAGDILAQNYAQ